MLDIRWIRDNPEAFARAAERRGSPSSEARELLGRVIAADDARKAAVQANQAAQERRNALSKEIGRAMAAKDLAAANDLKAEVAALKDNAPALEAAEKAADETLFKLLSELPNIPQAEVPDGADEHGNVPYVAHLRNEWEWTSAPRPEKRLEEGPDHVALGEALGQIDFETAAKLSGARFVVLRKDIARLSRALGQFMLDTHVDVHGYTEVNPPLMTNAQAMFGTAQLPKFWDDQFRVLNQDHGIEFAKVNLDYPGASQLLRDAANAAYFEGIDDFLPQLREALPASAIARLEQALDLRYRWLVPTAEVPLTNLVREQIVEEATLPRRYTALTPCFRAEAGAAGRDTRGMLRQHQFEKVELVSVTTPEDSADEHERMLSCAEHVLKRLGLHYRVMTLCTGDMGFASTKTYDIEAWLPGQKTYREISSCSNCGDFQARRMNARYRPAAGGSPRFVHTLNGSGVAIGRCLIAVIENYQNPDGSITIPEALRAYMGGRARIEKAA